MITWYEIAGILARTVQYGKMNDPELETAKQNPDACKELLRKAQNGEISDKYMLWLGKANLT